MSRFSPGVDVSRRLAEMQAQGVRADIENFRNEARSREQRRAIEQRRRELDDARREADSEASRREGSNARRITSQAGADAQSRASDQRRAARRDDAIAMEELQRARYDRALTAPPPSPADFMAAQSGIQELLLNPTPLTADGTAQNLLSTLQESDDTHLADAIQPHAKARARKAAADLAQLSKFMGQPGVTRNQIAQAQAQFAQQYPEFAQRGIRPAPMTSEQAAQLQTQIREQQYNAAAQQILRGETPEQLLFTDDKGNLAVPKGIMDVVKLRQSQEDAAMEVRRAEQKAETERFARAVEIIDAFEPSRPRSGASPAEIEHYERMRRLNDTRRWALYQKHYGGAGAMPEDIEQRVRQAQQIGASTVTSREDFDQLPIGEVYVDAETGETARKIDTTDVPVINDMAAYDALPIGKQFIDAETGELMTKGAVE